MKRTAALIALLSTLQSSLAGYAPSPGYHARILYDTAGSFTIMEGLSVDGTRAFFGQGAFVHSLGLIDGETRQEGALPGSMTAAFVQRLNGSTYAAFAASFTPPFPYALGSIQPDGNFSFLLEADGIFDAAVNGLGEFFFVASPDGAGSKIYKLNLPGSLTNLVVDAGGFSGGLAFDADSNLYYAYQAPFPTPSQIVRFTAAQVAAGGLTIGDGEVFVDVGATYLAFDENGDLYATTGFGNTMNKYEGGTGRLMATAVVDDAGGFGVGKFTWDAARNQLLQIYTDFTAFESRLYGLTTPYAANDFDRDGRTDIAVYHPAAGTWFIRESETGNLRSVNWGWQAASPVVGDYDGDARADVAVYWPQGGLWFILPSGGGGGIFAWGWSETVPVPADYDGDGVTDIAVYHPATGDWYIRQSSDLTLLRVNWGWRDATPVPADYDGDGQVDIAVYHQAAGDWYIRQSSDGVLRRLNWGWGAARPVPGDYDGDGQADPGVYHVATGDWYIRQSSTGALRLQNWGWSATIPTAADYDADGRTDLAVYHPDSGDWFINQSRDDGLYFRNWGWSAAVPTLPSP